MPPVIDPSKRICTAANFVSMSRLLLLIPLFYFLREGNEGDGNVWAIVVMGIALITDMLDGLLARVMNQVTEWGKVLDPIADKLWICALAAFLAAPWREHPLPVGFLTIILVRDLSIVTFALWAFRKVGVVMTSNWLGKVTMLVEALTLIAFTVHWSPINIPGLHPYTLMWIAVPLIVLSAVSYALNFRTVMTNAVRRVPVPDTPSRLKVSS